MIKIEVVNNEKYKVTLGGSPLDMLSELNAIIDSMLDFAAKDGEKPLCFMADMISTQTNRLIERRFKMLGTKQLMEEMLKIQAEEDAARAATAAGAEDANKQPDSYTREQVDALIAQKIAEYAESEKDNTNEKENENNGTEE